MARRRPHLAVGSFLRRLKGRAQGRPPVSFPPGRLEEWEDHGIQFAHLFQTCASAVVASWEVAAAELNRSLAENHPELEANTWVTRLSDSLVPTLTPIQDAERAARGVWTRAAREGLQSRQPEDALAPLAGHVAELGITVPEGWASTVEYLEPLAAALQAPQLIDRLAARSRALGALFSDRSEELGGALLAASRAPNLEPAVLAALDDTRMALQQDLEVALAASTELLLEACRR